MNRTSFAKRCCGVVKRLRLLTQDHKVPTEQGIWPAAIENEVNQLAANLQQQWPDRFGLKYLKTNVKKKFRELAALDVGPDTAMELAKFFDGLQSFSESKLCIAPIEGIELVGPEPISIGPFTLRLATSTSLNLWSDCLDSAIQQTRHTSEEKQAIAQEFQKEMETELQGRLVLEMRATAEPEQARSLFAEKASGLVDLLQVSTKIAQWSHDARIALRGRPHAGLFRSWVIPLEPGAFLIEGKWVGNTGILQLNETNLELMRRAGIFDLASTLGRDQTPFERTLLRAAHWFAQATLEENAGRAVLFLAICLETILVGSKAREIAENVALLAGTTFLERMYIQSLVLEAFLVRNDVVHKGETTHAASHQRQFFNTVLDVMVICIHLCKEIKEREGLRKHIDQLRFG